MVRAPCCEKVGLKRGRWTKEEDEILINYIEANGEGSWRSLPKNAGLLRCGKSCRLRWINYLRADLKRGNFSHSEEDIIIKLHASFGNKWSLIASNMPGRTDNEIKNYWNSHLSRKIETFRRHISNIDSVPMVMDLSKVITNPSKSKGKVSRWAMKKNKSSTQISASGSILKKKTKEASNYTTEIPILPTTPTIIEKEVLSINEYMVLEDQDGSEDKSMNNNLESPNGNSMLCLNYDDGIKLFGPGCNEETGIYDGVLSFNDVMEDKILLCSSGVLFSSEERQSNDVVEHMNHVSEERDNNGVISPNISNEEIVESSGNMSSSNGEIGDKWYYNSSYSMNSLGIDLDNGGVDSSWDWESVLDDGQEIWDEKMLSWLWENDDWELSYGNKFEEVVDSEKQNAMVAWLLS